VFRKACEFLSEVIASESCQKKLHVIRIEASAQKKGFFINDYGTYQQRR
jgi:hypothetical protein